MSIDSSYRFISLKEALDIPFSPQEVEKRFYHEIYSDFILNPKTGGYLFLAKSPTFKKGCTLLLDCLWNPEKHEQLLRTAFKIVYARENQTEEQIHTYSAWFLNKCSKTKSPLCEKIIHSAFNFLIRKNDYPYLFELAICIPSHTSIIYKKLLQHNPNEAVNFLAFCKEKKHFPYLPIEKIAFEDLFQKNRDLAFQFIKTVDNPEIIEHACMMASEEKDCMLQKEIIWHWYENISIEKILKHADTCFISTLITRWSKIHPHNFRLFKRRDHVWDKKIYMDNDFEYFAHHPEYCLEPKPLFKKALKLLEASQIEPPEAILQAQRRLL